MNNPEALLHYLDVLIKESNFTKAAQELNVSQPYLTQLIKRIEKRLGTKILNRAAIPFALTTAGAIYYQYLENIADQDQQLNQQLVPFTINEREVIKIGISESLGSFLLPQLLPPFLKKYPKVKIQLCEDSGRQNRSRLLNNKIDCYFGQTPETITAGLDYSFKAGEAYYLVIPQNSAYYHPKQFILSKQELDLKKVLQSPLILTTLPSPFYHQITGLLQELEIKPQIILSSKNLITATELALKGLGLTISSASVLQKMQPTPINLLPLESNLFDLKLFMATKSGHKLNSPLQGLIALFKNSNFKNIS